MKTRWAALALIALLPVAPSGAGESKLGAYFRDRALDLADVFRIRIGLPKNSTSFGLKARATGLAQIGYVQFEGDQIGFDRRAAGVFRERRREFGVGPLYYTDVQTDMASKSEFADRHSDWSERQIPRQRVRDFRGWGDGRRRPLSLGVEIESPILPGLDLGLYPTEFVDFALGWLGFDMYDDDLRPLEERAEARRAARRDEAIDDAKDFLFEESYDDLLAPYEYAPPAPGEPAL